MSRKKTPSDEGAPLAIKKYANRRLYNTATSSYVTLDDLCQMVKEGTDFVVYDAKTGEDLTRSVLTQIIVEEESKGQNLLPINFLRQLIGFYGGNLQNVLPNYLECSMQAFSQNQERLRQYMSNTFGISPPLAPFEELGKQNLAIFEQMMGLFAPFQDSHGEKAAPDQEETETAGAQTLHELREQLRNVQRQLEEITKKSEE
ncbi:MAG: polyhydroxyalkanoate synthesis repressor PhaR [Alphaproteobacteria bacterium]|nr:polyhydroxyalkanoate synthesis repressor PhaR [Alphaproteobacteria bacterium]